MEELKKKIEKLLLKVQRPSRYIGGEVGSVVKDKDKVDVRFAFCFPDTYEVGMSHLGMKILYGLKNARENWWCERVFMPEEDYNKLMRENDIPLYALESLDPIKDFDFIGFTLMYELSYNNVLEMLDLAGVPVLAKDRTELTPLVIAGGPCACNPEPMADFFDLFILGEGEEVNVELLELYERMKPLKPTKQEFLREAAKLEGVYVPSFYDVDYNEDGTVKSITPNVPEAPARVKKRVIKDFDKVYYPEGFVVPFTQIVHDRAVVEVLRGCIRGCRFCQAGFIYRPFREKSIDTIKNETKSLCEQTGYEEVSLSSLSTSDYTEINKLLENLVEYTDGEQINLSLPSLRIDNFSEELLEKIKSVRKSGLTFAPEAGSQRMRDVINKGLTEEIILEGAGQAFEGGWNKVKLYFMLGLPTETEEDMKAIAHLAEKVARRYYEIPKEQRNGKCQITASSSFFIPKPFTPFQWAQMFPSEEYIRRATIVKHEFLQQLNKKSLKYNWHEADVTVLEGVFARGDRKVGKVIEEAYRLGCLYDSWSESFDNEKWMQAFANTGVDIEFYTMRERSMDELFPWDFIDIGVTKNFLKKEWERAMNAQVTPNCRMQCSGCGAAKFGGGVCFEGKN